MNTFHWHLTEDQAEVEIKISQAEARRLALVRPAAEYRKGLDNTDMVSA